MVNSFTHQNQKWCLDASVVAKLLTREKDSLAASKLFKQLISNNQEIIEPSFLKIEVYSVIRKKCSLKEISSNKAKVSLGFFAKLPLNYYQEDKKLLDDAFQLAERLEMVVVYDCIYLTLASRKKAIFVTADIKFLKKAKGFYKNCFSLSSTLS